MRRSATSERAARKSARVIVRAQHLPSVLPAVGAFPAPFVGRIIATDAAFAIGFYEIINFAPRPFRTKNIGGVVEAAARLDLWRGASLNNSTTEGEGSEFSACTFFMEL